MRTKRRPCTMSWASKAAVLSGVGAGLLGALATIHALRRWRYCRCGSSSLPVNTRNRSLRSQRKLKLYHTVDGTALPNTQDEHLFPFRSSRCVWLVRELGIEDSVEVEKIDLQSEDVVLYRAVHPHTTLPALKLEDGRVLLESAAICIYLADSFVDPEGHDLLPDEEHKACYYDLICYAAATFDHVLEPLYLQLTHTSEDKRNQDLVDSMMRKFSICANVLSQHLSDKKYICGDKFTAADCVIGFNVWWASVIKGGALLEDYPGLKDYLDRLKGRPCFKKTFELSFSLKNH